MEIKDILFVVLAIWGAGLSTYLGIRELSKEKRRIRIFVEHIHWVERFQLTLVNVGHRPVTITSVAMTMLYDEEGIGRLHREPIYAMDLFDIDEKSYPFPFTLSDGQHMDIPIKEDLGMSAKSRQLEIQVFDAEGNVYSDYRFRNVDTKWGTIENLRK